MFLVRFFVILKLYSVVVFASLYANNYPYSAYEYATNGGSSSSGARGAADTNAYVKNQQHDVGNNVRSTEDTAKFYNKDNAVKGHDITQLKSGNSIDDTKRVTGENFETDKSHNRKHVKSGFRNTYNKDESGSNSSFFEDSDDRGEKLVYDKRHGTRGDAYDTTFRENLRDGSLRDRGDDRQGGHSVRGAQDQRHLIAQDQGNSQLYTDSFDRGHGERYDAQNQRQEVPQYHPPPISHSHGGHLGSGGGGGGGGIGIGANHGIYNNGYGNNLYRQELPPPLIDYRRQNILDYNRGSGQLYDNRLPPPQLPAPLPPPPIAPPLVPLPVRGSGLGGHEDTFYTRPSITIYDDPRDSLDPRSKIERREQYSSSVRGGSRYNSPRLDFRPSPIHMRDYYDERDHLRYRDY